MNATMRSSDPIRRFSSLKAGITIEIDIAAPPPVPLSFVDKVQVPRYTAGFRGENVVSGNGSSSMAESSLDRKFVGNITVERTLYIAIFIIAILLRTYTLGVRPYHHDESIP